ncbi:unnamed protein product [Adineta steineri]|uniref:Uncharacterized protein n=1 Tax=Adineta steineri TaxID=433720 RepID=A0A819LCX3_9BILA|nr:unnamed protein product [Adineta steineri]CAF1353575.1 unnamed protein product [Adineta steineri]CAF3964047.1 unnamed protein product [Adineta steineri]
MSNDIDTVDKLIAKINNGETLRDSCIKTFADNLLHNDSSNNACRIFLALAQQKVFITELVFERLCNIILHHHEQTTKENSIRTIDILITNGQKTSNICLNALSFALQNHKFPILKRYASKILCTLSEKQNTLRLDSSLLNAMSHALHDQSTTVQSNILRSFETLARIHRHNIPEQAIHSMETLLTNVCEHIDTKNYGQCGLITSFFLSLLHQQYKLNENLLEIFSELLIVEVPNHKTLSLNRTASYVLQKAIAKQLFVGHLTRKIFNNISICFNSISSQHKQILEYCLKILCSLKDDQLLLIQLDINLLKHYLKDMNYEISLISYATILFGNLCKISHENIDDNNMFIIEDTIDIFMERLDHEKLLQSSIYALKNIAQYKEDYLSIYPLRKFIQILNKNDLNKEIRLNACSILVLAIKNQQPLTKSEIDGLESALNDSDLNICNTTLIAFQHLFQIYYKINEDYFTMILSSTNNISISLIEFLRNSNETLAFNASKLLEIIIQNHLKIEFTNDEIDKLCLTLQTNLNESICKTIFYSLNKIYSKQMNIPQNLRDFIELENIAQVLLTQKTFNKYDLDKFEEKLCAYINDTMFHNKIITTNVFQVFYQILKTNLYTSTMSQLLLQCVQNGQKLPNYLIETLTNDLFTNKNIQILYYVVHNGQSLTDTMIQQLNKYFLENQFYSTYTIQIFKLLFSRNEIRIDIKIYHKFVDLLKNQKDYDIQRNLIETLTNAIQNISIDDELPRNEIFMLMEKYFVKNDTMREMTYYSCIALNALIENGTHLSDKTLCLLKYYAQDEEFDGTLTTISYSSAVNLRDISLKTLQKYKTMCETCANIIQTNEIKDIIHREMLGQTILENRNPMTRLKAAEDLLSIVKNEQQSLSKNNVKVLQSLLYSDDCSIELKLIIIKILEYISAHLNSSQIQFILSLIRDKTLSVNIINILKTLVHFKKYLPTETLNILIDFASENTNLILRDNVIDCLQAIIKYQNVSSDLAKRITFEILSKNIRNPKLDIEKKIVAVNTCLDFVQNRLKLSTNSIESLEYALKNLLHNNKIHETVFDIIELAIRNNEKLPRTLIDLFIHLTKDKERSFEIIKLLSKNNEQFITQEILDHSENYLLENLTESYPIFLNGTQNGCKLSKTTTKHLAKTLENHANNTSLTERLDLIKIFKNLAENSETLDKDVIQYLENTFNDNNSIIHQSILNTLKFLPDYQPSSKFLISLQNVLEQHLCYSIIGNILEKCYNLPIQVILHIVYVFFLIEYIENDIIHKPLKLVCRQLLCNDLLTRISQHDKYDEINQFEFYSNLNSLEDYFHFQPYSIDRDEILIFFIENHSNFSLKHINEILLLMKTNFKSLQILRIASNDWLDKLQIHWLNTIIKRYQHIQLNENVILTDDNAKQILHLLIVKLKFGVSLSECFLQRLHNIEDFNELVLFLNNLYEKRIYKQLNLHEYFTRTDEQKIITKDLDSWHIEIQCGLIKKKIIDLCKLRNFNEINFLQNIQSIILLTYINNWTLDVFQRLFDILKAKQDEPFSLIIKNFFDALNVINNYGIQHEILDHHNKNAELIFQLKDSNQWALSMHKFAVSVSFDHDEREKSLKDLLDEIKKYVL